MTEKPQIIKETLRRWLPKRVFSGLSHVRRSVQKLQFQYRFPRGPQSFLGEKNLQTESMNADFQEPPADQDDLYAIWHSIPHGLKWLHYFPIYERFFGEYRKRPIRFLEVGVFQGHSLKMWRRYFHPDTVIVGIDINPDCTRFEDAPSNVHVRIGDQSDTVFLEKVIREFGPFDIILDDGSHICSHMVKTFDYAFLNGLTDNGLYLAEDTHTNFWLNYRDQTYSFIDLGKDLVDYSHAHYVNHETIADFEKGNPQRLSSISVPRIGREIQEISFFDSIIAIRRNKHRTLPTAGTPRFE